MLKAQSHTHIQTHTHTHTDAYTYRHIHIRTYTHSYTYIHSLSYTYTFVDTHTDKMGVQCREALLVALKTLPPDDVRDGGRRTTWLLFEAQDSAVFTHNTLFFLCTADRYA